MTGDKLRQQIIFEAARLMFQRQESEFVRAKVRAARTICRQRLRPSELPTNREIREELQRLASVYGATDGFALPVEGEPGEPVPDRFRHYRNLLVPLSRIRQDLRAHPEGDVLYHSLQVYRLVREQLPYDEELLLAALLHDVGLGIDPINPVVAGLVALGDSISSRTAWLIENNVQAQDYLGGTIGIRARRRLQRSENYDELILLAKCDTAGRVPGAQVSDLDDALEDIRHLAQGDE